MKATLKLRKVLAILLLIFIPLQVWAAFSALLKYTTSNIIFYYVMVYFTMSNLFSERPHHICAFMWSLLTAYLLGWFWGGMAVLVYWGLYFIKVKYAPKTSSKSSSKSSKKDDEDSDEDSDDASTDDTQIVKFGRIPFVRIPLPWLKYTLDLELGVLTRDCLFPEKRDKDNPKRDLLGKDDDLLLNQVFDWSFSTKPWRILAGTSCFEFQSKKIGKSGDKKNHWHCIPSSMIKPLRAKLIEVNNKPK